MKQILSVLELIVALLATSVMAQASPSGTVIKTSLGMQILGECNCEGMVLSATTAPLYSYKVLSSTNLIDWVTEYSPLTTMTNTMSWALAYDKTDRKFFRVEEMGPGAYVTTTLDPTSPLSRTMKISATEATLNVPLAVYNVKSHLSNSTLSDVIIEIVASTSDTNMSHMFSAVKLRVGSLTYSGHVLITSQHSVYPNGSYGWMIMFSNMNIPLLADIQTPLVISVDINPDTGGALSGKNITLGSGGIEMSVHDNAYPCILPSETGPTNNTVLTITSVSAILNNLSATKGSGSVNYDGTIAVYGLGFGFSVTAMDQPIYIALDPGVALTTTTVGSPSFTIGGMTTADGFQAGDMNGPSGYIMVYPGTTRTISYSGSIGNNGSFGVKSACITGIHFGTSPSDMSSQTISYGLETLKILVDF